MSAPVDRRRLPPDAMMNFRKNPNMTPQRKVSMEHIHGLPSYPIPPNTGVLHPNDMQRMNDMMMMEYQGMMGMGPDPYDMSFMPMHPSEAAAMGPNNFMMDQMMDFPPPRFMAPMRRPGHRPPRGGSMLPGRQNQMDGSGGMMEMHHPIQSPEVLHPRIMMPTSKGPPMPLGDMADPSLSFSTSSPTGSCTDIVTTTPQGTKRKERAPSSTSFPTKLYKILADPQYEEYIAWLPHGRAWRVLKPKALEEEVIPKFFRSDRYASFMRQVRLGPERFLSVCLFLFKVSYWLFPLYKGQWVGFQTHN
jgi:HSF-type DNA-binding